MMPVSAQQALPGPWSDSESAATSGERATESQLDPFQDTDAQPQDTGRPDDDPFADPFEDGRFEPAARKLLDTRNTASEPPINLLGVHLAAPAEDLTAQEPLDAIHGAAEADSISLADDGLSLPAGAASHEELDGLDGPWMDLHGPIVACQEPSDLELGEESDEEELFDTEALPAAPTPDEIAPQPQLQGVPTDSPAHRERRPNGLRDDAHQRPNVAEFEPEPTRHTQVERGAAGRAGLYGEAREVPGYAEELPCERLYEGRNCCTEEAICRRANDIIEARNVMEISLNISPPPVDPLETNAAELEAEFQGKLTRSPPREWHDRCGKALGYGKLVDFRNGEVIIRSTSGEVALPYHDLSHDDLCFVSAWWDFPPECTVSGDERAERDWQMITFTWKASGLCHKPLYFEQPTLERYGHTVGPFWEPIISGTHFYASAALLPYSMGLYPWNECRYTLGYYTPGSCAPWMIHAFPLSKRAALSQLTAVLGLWGYIN
jgi:hypothetical protein